MVYIPKQSERSLAQFVFISFMSGERRSSDEMLHAINNMWSSHHATLNTDNNYNFSNISNQHKIIAQDKMLLGNMFTHT